MVTSEVARFANPQAWSGLSRPCSGSCVWHGSWHWHG